MGHFVPGLSLFVPFFVCKGYPRTCHKVISPGDFFYPKITHEVMSYQAIFILGCGCNVKNLGPAMLVYPKIAHEVMPYQAIFILRSLRYLLWL
ncbi:MAG: hypothetical protein L3J49_06745 [Desulfobulbaceae bacterium]|nr:hypothetical protein [Desulfobulbaceae bacterium]